MLRTAILRSLRAGASSAARRQLPIARRASPSSFIKSSPAVPIASFQAIRCYSAPSGLSQQEVQGRIMDLLKNFDKVTDPSKLAATSHFANDLGLDSLDTVEVVMAIEEEFSIEIPDKEADAIHSIDKAVEYILAQPDAH
ncbi:MAG: Acyl carrier protein, mitochondrial [Chaenotheca gracillima]|nr:MAG: Acyl carrier protein, mitochondrial [Chaenotheca gracillima]